MIGSIEKVTILPKSTYYVQVVFVYINEPFWFNHKSFFSKLFVDLIFYEPMENHSYVTSMASVS